MKYTNPLLLIDYYKSCHAEMLPKGMTKSVSYFTPRMSRVDRWDHVVNFGLQGFIKKYLIDYFNEEFFNKPKDEVVSEYRRVLDATLGKGNYGIEKIEKLWDLRYLPIEIGSLPEGVKVPMHVPMFYITNTHPDFAWLPQALESLISAEAWHPMIAATVGATYREIVDKYYSETVDDSFPHNRALGNFDFRGEECLDSATKAGAAWCLSFVNTATVPSVTYLEDYYNCDCTKEPVGFGTPSTEHAVMCSNFAVDGDEETLIKRLLKEIYPHTSFTCVLDSYDYDNVLDVIIPKLKDDILAHDGCFSVRGDSGECVEVVTTTVFKLWDIFGGTINSKGYKVLNPHVKAIYGDSITVQRCEEIYKILKDHGFACNNVSLGVGSFSFQCIEENGELKPFTRDTFSSCIKATYCEINGVPTPIFKNPKHGGFKKSQKGCCIVHTIKSADREEDYAYVDEKTWKEASEDVSNQLKVVFRDGKILKDWTLSEVRKNLHKEFKNGLVLGF